MLSIIRRTDGAPVGCQERQRGTCTSYWIRRTVFGMIGNTRLVMVAFPPELTPIGNVKAIDVQLLSHKATFVPINRCNSWAPFKWKIQLSETTAATANKSDPTINPAKVESTVPRFWVNLSCYCLMTTHVIFDDCGQCWSVCTDHEMNWHHPKWLTLLWGDVELAVRRSAHRHMTVASADEGYRCPQAG